ncbi:hypothetical protein [Cronobacter turicensis]|uniref:hypothetical protein n=1 Tax=Cronobacter turicensis TaxID=413502 RepID=UPI0024C21ED7|nr:hypothetical protein [Cronobacter turicensis]ELY3758402.1 hypothetical protein [Cronobacter universalis]ELY5850943.1 hypothetical protein [Cronobacter turicensis]MDK1227330.1 hypothetical protein [Cronobacter turicensis]MDK1335870.1 hypothetical protein [Cronobacter turicensis]
MTKLYELKRSLDEALKSTEFDSPQGRAELIEFCVENIYKFVKFERPEGEGLDGRDGPERQTIGELVDAVKDYKFDVEMSAVNNINPK